MTKTPSKLTLEVTSECLFLLAECFGFKLPDARVEVYWLALSDRKHGITAESMRAATKELISTSERFPVPAQIIALARRSSSAGIDGMYLPAAKVLDEKATCLFHRQPGNRDRPSSEPVWFCPVCASTGRKKIRSKGGDGPKQLSAILDDSRALAERVKKEY